MKVVIIIGHTGTGKSPIVRSFIGKQRPCFIFDYQDEYGFRTKYKGQVPDNISTDITKSRSRDIRCDVDLFIQTAFTRRNTVVVFEDATGFVHGSMGVIMKRLLTNKMFTKNTYILCFHAILDVPTTIMNKADTVILLPTVDDQYKVEKKYPKLLNAFKCIQQSHSKMEIVKMI